MHFTFSKTGWESPPLILCELNKQRIGEINTISLSAAIRWTSLSEFSFETPSTITSEGVNCPNELFDDIRELRLIEIPNFGYFQIRSVQTNSDGIRKIKSVKAYSAEVMFQDRRISDVQGEYRLWNPIRPQDSIMGILLTKMPGWTLGNVAGVFTTRQRTLSVTENSLYAFIMNDLAEAFEALFIFDYENFTIDIVDKTQQFRATSIYMDYDNLVKNSQISVNVDDIVTKLRVVGASSNNDTLDISGVNPTGTDTLVNVDYFIPRMSAGLQTALAAYKVLFSTLQPQYASLLTQLRNLNIQRMNLIDQVPPYTLNFNPTQNNTATITPSLTNTSGLTQLEGARRQMEGVRQARIENGNIPYTDVNNLINQITPMINARRTAITNIETQIADVQNQLQNITNQLHMQNNFTPAQWVELNRYFIEDTYSNPHFLTVDDTTPQERQDIQRELFDVGSRILERASFPSFTVDIDSVNFLFLKEFNEFTQDFELGTTFKLGLENDMVVDPLLLGVDIDFNDPTNFRLHYSNKHYLDDDFRLVDFAAGQINASNAISFSLAQIENMRYQQDDVTAFINGALKANLNELISSPVRTSIKINEHGLRAKTFDWNTGQELNYQSWLTGSQLAFSRDRFTTAQLALGRIQAPGATGGTVFGLVGDTICVKILKGDEFNAS